MRADAIQRLTRRQKQALAVACDCVTLSAALWIALVLRHGHWHFDLAPFWPGFAITLACVPLLAHFGLYRHVMRYMGPAVIWTVLKGVVLTAVMLTAIAYMFRLEDFPRSVPVIFALLAFCGVAGTRFLVRASADAAPNDDARKSVAIYNAGEAAAHLAQQLLRSGGFRPVAFIDDDDQSRGRVIHGLRVVPLAALDALIGQHGIEQVLVAPDSASAEDHRRIIEELQPYPVRVRLIPDIKAVVAGAEPATSWDVEIADLLGRDEVLSLPHLLRKSVTDRGVMVTGAGGSIGSELCRQILRLGPKRLVVFDQSEYWLYQIERELRRIAAAELIDTPVVAVLGSLASEDLMERTMRHHRIDTVYHAAAYKHVNLAEENVVQVIENNTFGTLRTARAAMAAGVGSFILISTDKAVRARNVLGASKRLAEMLLQALDGESETTRFCMVRCGNVLDSSGSVVPLFLEQIDKGGPVTVTHPQVTRYFMTITEAAALVLQAGSMATGGDVFVLDMGEPVKIHELARKMIRLKGYNVRDEDNPGGDIEIHFTGLRSGEKLTEELLVGEGALGTEHRKILRAVESDMPWSALEPALANLEGACDAFDYEAIGKFLTDVFEGADLAGALSEFPHRRTSVAIASKVGGKGPQDVLTLHTRSDR